MALFRLRRPNFKRRSGGSRYAASPFHEAADRGAYLRPKQGLTLFNRKGQTIRPGTEDRYEMERPPRRKKRGGGLFGQKPRGQRPMRDTGTADLGRETSNYRSRMLAQGARPGPDLDRLVNAFHDYKPRKKRK